MTAAAQVVWVCGGGSGIGLAAAQAMVDAGARVIISGRRRDALIQGVAALDGKAEGVVCDVRDAVRVQVAADDIAERYGRIDVLVNSAGLNVPNRRWADQTVASWDEVIRTNLDGAFFTARAVLPTMRAQGGGLIINIASWAGRYTTALVGTAYNAAKHGVVSMSETINMEEGANGVRACAICPGEVATPIMERRPVPPSAEDRARMLQPDDVGRLVRWVCEQPASVCVNEVVISPTWNRIYRGS
jgi:NADP-dependent 3-hydroxy acid dehydrogenase YdfG